MATEKAKGPGYLHLHLRLDDMTNQLVSEFIAGKPASWPLVPKLLLHRVWSDFSQTGVVHNEGSLERIFEMLRDNLLRLQVANIVSGHEGVGPDFILEGLLDESQYEPFCDWLIEFEETWRISDYGIGPLTDALALAFESKTLETKLKYMDRALNVTHQRGDLSRLFVEGGRSTVLAVDLDAIAA